jgi:hypothetical protein
MYSAHEEDFTMARVLIFDGLLKDEHTFYEDAETGTVVQVYPGSQIPARVVIDPDHYVNRGMARMEGIEDGTDGRLDRLMDQLRLVLAEIAPLKGQPRTWKLDDMLAQAQELQAADVASRAAFAEAEATAAAAQAEEIKAQDAAGGGTSEVAPV